MKIKEFISGMRQEIAGILDPEKKAGFTDYASGFVNLWDLISGKIQPSDYKAQVEANEGWVYACATAIAESCAMQRLTLHAKRGDKVEQIDQHIFLDTWNSVNPFMNNFELQELTELYQLLTGNAYWFLIKNKLGIPEEIWPVPAQFMKIVPSKKDFISGYIYEPPGADKVAFTPDEIVHFKYANPNNIYYGMGPLLAAAYAVDAEENMDKYQSSQFKSGGLPAALLSSDQVINVAEANRMREQWKQLYGGTDKAGKVAILSKGLKFQTIAMNAQEMAFIQSRTTNRDKILAIFRVPKSILGLVDDVNRANAEATEYIFNLRNIKPKLIRKQEKINERIMPLYKQTSGSTILFVQYADPVPANRELEDKERTSRLTTAVTTINEEREKLGMKPVEWGEVPLLPATTMPLGSAPETPPEEPPKPPAEEDDTDQEDETDEDNEEAEHGPEILKAKKAMKYFHKARVWRIYKARFESEVYDFRNALRRLFAKQRQEVLSKLDKYAKKDAADPFIFIVAEWEDKFEEKIGPEFEKDYTAGAKHASRIAGLGLTFNLNNPVAQRWLEEKIFTFSFETNKRTEDQLRDELNEGLKAGETHKDLAARVNKVFDFAENYRGMRIARTEVADAENRAIQDTWTGAEVGEKQWLHGGGGDEPRPEHVAMSQAEETVPMGARFSNGLLYPGDQAQGPGEVCNCTCTLLPVIK
jgi:HK97 family phage portal protein